jgi:hypothetical protein
MRIWDISPEKLCRNHLLGEHRELHAIWNILTQSKKGYAQHPETLRWKGKLKALYLRHEKLVRQLRFRGYQHHSVLSEKLAQGQSKQNIFVDSARKQVLILRNKKCFCDV